MFRLSLIAFAAAIVAPLSAALAQVPVDAASDRRPDSYVFFKAFGEPDLPFKDLHDVQSVRANSARHFKSELATCKLTDKTCSADTVYELADKFCQALEFSEAVSWRTSKSDDTLTLHWVICGLKR